MPPSRWISVFIGRVMLPLVAMVRRNMVLRYHFCKKYWQYSRIYGS